MADQTDLRVRGAREVPGRHYQTPKEFWGFLLPPQRGTPETIARRVLAANASRLGLEGILDELACRRMLRSVGASHAIFSQRHLQRQIHRAYVTVHMTRAGEVYLIKNRAAPIDLLPEKIVRTVSVDKALAIALRAIRRTANMVRIARVQDLWFPEKRRFHFAYKFRFHRNAPAEDWSVFVSAENGEVLSKYNNLAAAVGRARVFEPNPVVALGDWRPLLRDGKGGPVPVRRVPDDAYTDVHLRDISASGTLSGPRVTTRRTEHRLRRANLDFTRTSTEPGFEEVMVYHHIDQAVRYVQSLGYRGPRELFPTPLDVNARASRDDNSFYHPGKRMLGFGTGDVDDAEDGETILHEFGHALQDAICPDFGQSQEAAAMGEGFGDYCAASFFAGKKVGGRRRLLRDAVMTWDGILWSDDDPKRPPCVRRLDSALTYESFDHAPSADEHDNGEIWSATLWDVWKALGRDTADRLIFESHFQLDAFTTFARGARAILDADRNLFDGAHERRLRTVFRRRGIGPVE